MTKCKACGKELRTCGTIYAAEGILYCSRECGRRDFETEQPYCFDDIAEEINPRDMGLPYMTLHELSERNFTRAVIVFKDESYDNPYPFESRAYEVSGDSNYFKPHKISKALFGTSLDGTDVGVRLDWYLGDWIVDYCFIVE